MTCDAWATKKGHVYILHRLHEKLRQNHHRTLERYVSGYLQCAVCLQRVSGGSHSQYLAEYLTEMSESSPEVHYKISQLQAVRNQRERLTEEGGWPFTVS